MRGRGRVGQEMDGSRLTIFMQSYVWFGVRKQKMVLKFAHLADRRSSLRGEKWFSGQACDRYVDDLGSIPSLTFFERWKLTEKRLFT